MTDIILPNTDIIPPAKPEIIVPKKKKIVALRPSQVVNKKRVLFEFEGKWLDVFGKPENIAKWFITGPSFSGKSTFIYDLCSYLCNFGNMDYDSFEEGDSQTTSDKIVEHGILNLEQQFRLLPKVPIEDFKERMLKKRSAQFGVVDSLQHAQLNKRGYIDLVNSLCIPRKGKSLLFISHWVKDDFTKHVKHDCDIKIEIHSYILFAKSRYNRNNGGKVAHVLWEEGAKKHWGKDYKRIVNGGYWPIKEW